MRFFRPFSILRAHRRTKSDSAAIASVTQPQTRPNSFHYFGRDPIADPPNGILSIAVPPTSTAVTYPISPCDDPLQPSPRPTLAAVNTRILQLETENNSLKDTTHAMATQFAALQGDLLDVRSDLYAERHRNEYMARRTTEDQEEIDRYEGKLGQYEKFIELMLSIGIRAEPVLSNAHGALRAGEDADVALVESIKEAASRPDSAWASIISSVTGPRTSTQYLSVLNLTLGVRRELRESKKIAKFWKRLAQESGDHGEIITPSPSNISSIHELLSPERQAAVNALVIKRRCASRLDQGVKALPEDSPLASPIDNDMLTANHTPNDAPTSCPPSGSAVSSMSFSAYVLPPLASESFKQELFASHSSSNRFTGRNSYRRRSGVILGEVGLNSVSSIPHSGSLVTKCSNISVKTMGRRRATGEGRCFESSMHSNDHFQAPQLVERPTVNDITPHESKEGTRTIRNRHPSQFAVNPPPFSPASDELLSSDSSNFQRKTEQRVAQELNSSDEWTNDPNLDFSFEAESVSTAPTTPTKTHYASPAKVSKLPVLKRLRRFSPKILTTELKRKTTSPPVIKTKSKPIRPAVKPVAVSSRKPTRLPTFTRVGKVLTT